jgi:transposase
VTCLVYQQIITAYAHPDPREGKALLTRVIDTVRAAVPAGLDELATLGRTLQRRRADVLAYFTHRASNGPTEAINGRLEALRRNCLGFRNLINYRIRSLPALRITRTLIPEELDHRQQGPAVQGDPAHALVCLEGILEVHRAATRTRSRPQQHNPCMGRASAVTRSPAADGFPLQ